MDNNALWKALDNVQAQIRAYDAKSQIVIGIVAALLGTLASQMGSMAGAVASYGVKGSTIALLVSGSICLIVLVVSLGCAVLTVYPRLQLNQPRSQLFFVHLAEDFGKDYSRARAALIAMTEPELASDLANQIQANSLVCHTKANRFRVALLTMASGLLLWCLTLALHFYVQHMASMNKAQRSTTLIMNPSGGTHGTKRGA